MVTEDFLWQSDIRKHLQHRQQRQGWLAHFDSCSEILRWREAIQNNLKTTLFGCKASQASLQYQVYLPILFQFGSSSLTIFLKQEVQNIAEVSTKLPSWTSWLSVPKLFFHLCDSQIPLRLKLTEKDLGSRLHFQFQSLSYQRLDSSSKAHPRYVYLLWNGENFCEN